MNERKAERPGTDAQVPRDLPQTPTEAALEDDLVEVPTDEEEPTEAYPDPDEVGAGPRRDAAHDESVDEESSPQEPPD